MKLAELRDLIGAEAVQKGVRDYAISIDNMINQELQRITGKGKYAALETSFTFTQLHDGDNTMDLPEDYQLFGSLVFTPSSFSSVGWPAPYELSLGIGTGYQSQENGYPKFYRRIGNVLRFYPFSEFYQDDVLEFTYYRRPTLILDDDEFPVESLLQPVQMYVMSRIMRMRDSKSAQAMRADANQALLDARAESMGG